MILRFRSQLGMGEKAEVAESIVNGDDDHAVRCQIVTIVYGYSARAFNMAAAMEKQIHGQGLRGRRTRRPYVEREAILAHIILDHERFGPWQSLSS